MNEVSIPRTVRPAVGSGNAEGDVVSESSRATSEYDPTTEVVTHWSLEESGKAFVETVRDSALGGGRRRYVLHLRGGRWFIDNVKLCAEGAWEKEIL